jgi:hypothetical protein
MHGAYLVFAGLDEIAPSMILRRELEQHGSIRLALVLVDATLCSSGRK